MTPFIPLFWAAGVLIAFILLFEAARWVSGRSGLIVSSWATMITGVIGHAEGIDWIALIGAENASLALFVIGAFMKYGRWRTTAATTLTGYKT